MASTPKKSAGDNMPSVPFSYAQAAKGLSSTTNSSSAPSKVPSESATPAKSLTAAHPTPSETPSSMAWSDEVESKIAKEDLPHIAERSFNPPSLLEGLAGSEQTNGLADPLSPEPSLSTTSTLVKDDDTASIPNASSESTWENKSQGSQSGGRSNDRVDIHQKKGKRQGKESPKPKEAKEAKDLKDVPAPVPLPTPLHDAPIPSVNIWKQRAEKFASVPKSAAEPPTNGVTNPAAATGRSTSQPTSTSTTKDVPQPSKKERNSGVNGGHKSTSGSQEKPNRSSSLPNGHASASAKPPPPPVGDQELWPTPELAQDDERKKAQGKQEKGPTTAPRPHGKNEWKVVEYTPTVVFNTPVPLLNARRGGRGGGRIGKESGTRSGSSAGAGSGNNEKDDGAHGNLANGENSKKESSAKSKRALSTDAQTAANADRSNSGAAAHADKDGHAQESGSTTRQSSSQHNTFPRSGPGSKQRQNKKADLSVLAEKRAASAILSPTKGSSVAAEQNAITASPTEEADKSLDSAADAQSNSRSSPNDRRSSNSGSVSKPERGETRSRGGIRGGRNGSQSSQHAHTQSRSIRGAGPRSQSIPTDPVFNRYFNSYGPPSAGLAPIQTYIPPSIYEQFPVQPMSAVPYNRYVDTSSLIDMVTMQLDYYFSLDNLIKDTWLRKHMDSKGYVFLTVIANFNRLKNLTTDVELIKMCCYQSNKIEYVLGKDGIDRIRVKDGWEQWVLAPPERVPAAQTEGPDELLQPPVPRPKILEPYGVAYPVAPMTAGPEQTAHFPPFQSPNGIPPTHRASFPNSVPAPPNGYPQPVRSPNGETANGGSQDSSASQPSDADDFHDEQINFLTVIVRKQDADGQQPPPMAESRTFSNGSLDTKILKEESQTQPKSTGSQANGVKPIREPATPASSESRDALGQQATGEESSKASMNFFWIKDKDTPVEILPNNATNEAYTELRSKALFQRQNAVLGSCPYDMDVLYQFWSHFLIRNFNTYMYDEFRLFAFEDNRERASDLGLKNLLKYYDQALNNDRPIRERIARHYVDLVKTEMGEPDRPGFKQLRAAWRNGALNMRNRKRLTHFIDAELKTALEQ